MRMVSWNCCWQKEGFTDEKRNEILKLNPDILVVQECKQDDWEKLNYSSEKGHWYGDGKESQGDPNKNLGIGIFCKEKYSIDCSLFRGQDLSNMRYAVPYIIKKKNEEILTIFSVWTKSGYKNYHVPILNSLEYFYEKTNSLIAVIGDFNTGSQYGNKENDKFYENVKKDLKEKYELENCAFWQEWVPTFHKENDGNYDFYLDDHCFFEHIRDISSFGMGSWFHWSKHSDHVPIIIDFDDNFYYVEDIHTGKKSMKLTARIVKSVREIRKDIGWKSFVNELKRIPTTLKYGNYTEEI